MINKKAIGPVVAISGLLFVAVVSFIAIQGWVDNFKNDLFQEVNENTGVTHLNVGVRGIEDLDLYINTGRGLNINSITINNRNCNIVNGSYSGLQSFNIESCLENNTELNVEVVVYTDSGILSKYIILPDNSECYNPANIGKVGKWPVCDGMLIVNRDMLINAEWFLPNKNDRYITYNGINYTFGDSEYNIFTGQITDLGLSEPSICSIFFTDTFYCGDDAMSGIGFNADINYWDVSNVQSMSFLFAGTINFNQPLNNWDVSNVQNMNGMFYSSAFNQSLNNWDVSSVTRMNDMFAGGKDIESPFNQPLNNWDVSNVQDMNGIFWNAINFNQNLSSWCVEKIFPEPLEFSSGSPLEENLKPIWGFCGEKILLGPADPQCYSATVPSIGSWSGCENMLIVDSDLLASAGSFWVGGDDSYQIEYSGINYTFGDSEFNIFTGQVLDISNLFVYGSFNDSIGYWDVSNVKDMTSTFGFSNFNQDISNWNTSSVLYMESTFHTNPSFNYNLSSWNVSKVLRCGTFAPDLDESNYPEFFDCILPPRTR